MEDNGMALGIAGGNPLLGLGLDDIPVIHPELHEALQPVFEIMERDFPGCQLIIENGAGKITREETHGILFYKKWMEEFRSETMQRAIGEIYRAAAPIMDALVNDIKKDIKKE